MTEQPLENTQTETNEYGPVTFTEWGVLLGTAGITLLLDQLTKLRVVDTLHYGETWEPVSALSGIFDITYTRNTGAAFGMAQDFGGIFLIIAVIVVGAIFYFYRELPKGAWVMRIALGLQMGGALGNALDRVTRGFVVDFFHLHGWPIFNIADSAIVVGVGLLIVAMWWYEKTAEIEPSETI